MGRIVVDYFPQKDDPYHTRLTIGGNLIKYLREVITRTADLIIKKTIVQQHYFNPIGALRVLWNKKQFLGTPMERYEYICLPINIIPE